MFKFFRTNLLILITVYYFLSFFFFWTGKPKPRYMFDILAADEEYKRRFKIKQREIVEEETETEHTT